MGDRIKLDPKIFENLADAVSEAMDRERRVLYSKKARKVLDKIALDDPEMAWFNLKHPFEQLFETAIEERLKKEGLPLSANFVALYAHHETLERSLSAIIKRHLGGVMCSDKACGILRQLRRAEMSRGKPKLTGRLTMVKTTRLWRDVVMNHPAICPERAGEFVQACLRLDAAFSRAKEARKVFSLRFEKFFRQKYPHLLQEKPNKHKKFTYGHLFEKDAELGLEWAKISHSFTVAHFRRVGGSGC